MKTALTFLVLLFSATAVAGEIEFTWQGRVWKKTDDTATMRANPGMNLWSRNNVWIDGADQLHMKIRHQGSTWSCAELWTSVPLGSGVVQMKVISRLDQLDKNVVLGFFHYAGGSAPAETNEIDIEFARWGETSRGPLNYTVYPAVAGLPQIHEEHPITLFGDYTTHRIYRTRWAVGFESLHGHVDGLGSPIWPGVFVRSTNPYLELPPAPMPFHMNLWMHGGRVPSDGNEVEVIVKSFTFTPGP